MLKGIVNRLIAKKREGVYWDFKAIPHENSAYLLHDIISMANCNHDGDRYLIIGVNDPSKNCTIKGLSSNTPNRCKSNHLASLLMGKAFAGDFRPEVDLETIVIDNKEVDIIIIKNKPHKPYFLTKPVKDKIKDKVIVSEYKYIYKSY